MGMHSFNIIIIFLINVNSKNYVCLDTDSAIFLTLVLYTVAIVILMKFVNFPHFMIY